MDIGERIKSMRIEAGLSQTQLAKAIGKPQSTVSDWESSRAEKNKRGICAQDLILLAEALNTSVHKLITGNDPENITLSKELGLSDNVINRLKRWKKSCDIDAQEYGENAFPISKQIDFILSVFVDSPGIVMMLYEYLTSSYDTVTVYLSEESAFNIPSSALFAEGGFFSTTDGKRLDLEPAARLKIMDALKKKREKIQKEGVTDGKH